MRLILKLICRGKSKATPIAEEDRHLFNMLSTLFFLFDGFSDILQVFIAQFMLEGGATGGIAKQGAVAFQAFFAFMELSMTGFEAAKDVLELIILNFALSSANAKSFNIPPRLLVAMQLIQLALYSSMVYFYLKIMYGTPAETQYSVEFDGCIEFHETSFREQSAFQEQRTADCVSGNGTDPSYCPEDCPYMNNDETWVIYEHLGRGYCKCPYGTTVSTCVMALTGVCDAARSAGVSYGQGYMTSGVEFGGQFYPDTWAYYFTFSVIVAAIGQLLVVVPLLLALTKCGCIKSSFWEDYGLPKVGGDALSFEA
eukprot:CAMPEP_0172635384 /NCGR_PEP_ID=MMETSP1068-20121228/199128_1 /TAXON_ID=35684 /ORGANISM="Pseudopedinella elastica, Strain CCMP716" /LENGTH=311 /DNA_ID=CAMNT_0013447579 /DNA_START=607 /DNA_END=1542 /DNA_ORIENTATION=-